ncbi:hypothetical protein [Sinimarinibacterium thermocellulolyticum]|uniref:Periplasmic heavy metal sensor n=1 Tax=Sinimarinibacterium thermocellulolyticum TaxID=3170016 RepID=A0ABV2A735_9GAMM
MTSLKLAAAAALTCLALGAGAVYAGDGDNAGHDGKRMHRMHGPSLERMAFGNALAAELANRTGRSAEEIRALFEDGGPRKAAETLGLDRETMKEAMMAARLTLIAKAQAAQMITAEQAQTLREAKPRFDGKGPRPHRKADQAD